MNTWTYNTEVCGLCTVKLALIQSHKRVCAAGSPPATFTTGNQWAVAASVLLAVGLTVFVACLALYADCSLATACVGLGLVAGVVETGGDRRVKVNIERDSDGKPRRFLLSIGRETVRAEPGNSWLQTDHFKWVTRGLVDAPQSFRVFPDGAVEINGEKIHLTDPDACERFEHEINKKFTTAVAEHRPTAPKPSKAAPVAPDKVVFHVKLDELGHIVIECRKGEDRVETGLRGIHGLADNGLMVRPKTIHVHPLQEWVELDGVRYECSPEGAKALERVLNERYAPKAASQHAAIEIRENPAAATGFDIRFFVTRAGAKFEIKGHLCQEYLDLLQDQSRCDLLKPGIVLKLAPPYLIVRRKRPDGGEEPIPELPDVQYRRITAAQLEQILNHPLVRRSSSLAPEPVSVEAKPEFISLRVWRNPAMRPFLCLECIPAHGGDPINRALTHHNIAELQSAGVFQPNIEVSLSVDNRTLTILNKETNQREQFPLGPESTDSDIEKASKALTSVLKPPSPPPTKPAQATIQHQPESPQPPKNAIAATSHVPPPETCAAHVRTHGPDPVMTVHAGADAAVTVKDEATQPPVEIKDSPTAQHRLDNRPGLTTPDKQQELHEHSDSSKTAMQPKPLVEAVRSAEHTVPPGQQEPVQTHTSQPTAPPQAQQRELQPAGGSHPLADLFGRTDPNQANILIFKKLVSWFGIPPEEKYLSLPRVFENRRFEVINFTGVILETALDLRSEEFYGFYLTHIRPDKIELVYACRGRRLEWGPDRCLVMPGLSAEPAVFKGSALLGMAQNKDRRFAFVVTPEYKRWVTPHVKVFDEVCAQFVIVDELLSSLGQFYVIWPELPAAAG